MIRHILQASDPASLATLKKISTVLTPEDNVKELAKDLIETLEHSYLGIALAAPQIGVNKRMFVINRGEHKNLVIINPVIVSAVGRMKYDEGCLSFPDKFVRKVRKQFVKINYVDTYFNEQTMQFAGVDAICVAHEIDHLDGKLIL